MADNLKERDKILLKMLKTPPKRIESSDLEGDKRTTASLRARKAGARGDPKPRSGQKRN